MELWLVLIIVFCFIGLIFNLLGVVGLFRFPDVYTRLHAATKTTTFGTIFLCLAVTVYGFHWVFGEGGKTALGLPVHTLFALAALLATNPTSAHAIARAAHRAGVVPARARFDDLADKVAEKGR